MPGPDGQPSKMMGLVMDTTARRGKREAKERGLRELADHAARSRDFTAALASASTVDAIMEAARTGLWAYGADSLILLALRDRRLQVVASCGFDDACLEALSGLNPAHPTPLSVAVQWRSPLYLPPPESLPDDFPPLVAVLDRPPQRAWAALPVLCSDSKHGAGLFGSPGPRYVSCEERTFL